MCGSAYELINNINSRQYINYTKKRIGSFGISCKSTPILPLLTANIDVKATKLSCGLGKLKETFIFLLNCIYLIYALLLLPPSISRKALFGRVSLCGTLIHR